MKLQPRIGMDFEMSAKLLDEYTVEGILCKNKNITVYRFIEKHIYVGDHVILCRSS